MQHDGWLETYLHTRFPQLELSIRNLGFSADEINKRPRNDNFGDADKHLTHSKADVIWAFFGYNESFAGAAGVDAFKNELTKFIDHTLSQKYNGKSAPRLVLFTPIAHENLKSPHLPDGTESNARWNCMPRRCSKSVRPKTSPLLICSTQPRNSMPVHNNH